MALSFSFRKQTLILIAILGVIFHHIFLVDYAYLDEIHQLWNNRDNSNFVMFASQGRFITGWIIKFLFRSIDTISAIKFIRIISLTGWAGFILLWQYCIKHWNHYLQLSNDVLFFSTLFIICSPSLAVYIGWASCAEIFLGVTSALLAGHILFMHLYKQGDRIKLPATKILVIGLLSCTSLFIYQTTYGAFLLPFFFHFVFQKRELHKKLVIPVVLYILFIVSYYFLFKYSLKHFGLSAADRTDITYNLFAKLSFFIAHVSSQAFSFNFLYSAKSVFSQAFYPISVLALILLLYSTSKKTKDILVSILFIFSLLILIYTPLLAARENFASYRTMFAGTVAIAVSIFGLLSQYLKTIKENARRVAVSAIYMLILLTGYYNFNYQFIQPLRHEYIQIDNYVKKLNMNTNDTILFIRPDEHIFHSMYNTKVYKDEFGLPSTFKDWVPDPLIRQLVFENKQDRKLAHSLIIDQYDKKENVPVSWGGTSFIIDMNEILKNK